MSSTACAAAAVAARYEKDITDILVRLKVWLLIAPGAPRRTP